MLERATKGASTITFLQWTLVGTPLALVSIPIAWFFTVKVYKPAPIDSKIVQDFAASLELNPKMSAKEIKMLLIAIVMLVLWILSSWFPVFNVTMVALLGSCLLFVPGIEILEWKSFYTKNLNMDIFFLTGAILTMGNLMVSNGVSDWVVTLLPTGTMSAVALVGFVVIVIFVLLILFPASLSVVTFMTPPLVGLVTAMGINPSFIIIALGMAASNSFCLPFGAVSLITYGKGYYKVLDMAKSTIPLEVCFLLISMAWIPLMCKLLGII
jgi:sodium-dependent dicarboxylate transporter 2/3/5